MLYAGCYSCPRKRGRNLGRPRVDSPSHGGGPIVIKGIHTAGRCPSGSGRGERTRWSFPITAAANSIVLRPTLRILPEVVASVGDQIEVLLDGGIRRGSDIAKALCLGARGGNGRGALMPMGLGAAGGAGVARAIEILRADLIRTLKLLGCPSVAELDQSYVGYAG